MVEFQGTGIYEAAATGRAFIYQQEEVSVRRRHIESVEHEMKRIEDAKKLAYSQLSEIYEDALKKVDKEDAHIFKVYKMMLDDEDYIASIRKMIEQQSVNAEYAVALISDYFTQLFEVMDDTYMQARAVEVKDMSNLIISCLLNLSDEDFCDKKMPESFDTEDGEAVILCAANLTPREVISINKTQVAAIVLGSGLTDSHAAVLVKNMKIPAVVGLEEDFFHTVKENDVLIIDGHTGKVIINPDEDAK